jgi:transposase
MTYYAGLDVSLRSTNICVIDDEGELLAEGKTDAEVADIVAFLDELKIEIAEVGLEAGTLTQYLTYGLQFAGFEVVCMEARQVKAALSAMRNKTERLGLSALHDHTRCWLRYSTNLQGRG